MVSFLILHQVDKLRNVFSLFVVLIQNGYEFSWSLIRSFDLDHSMLVTKSFLAHAAQVKVLHNDTLVSWANNWTHVASIASNVMVDSSLFVLVLALLINHFGISIDLLTFFILSLFGRFNERLFKVLSFEKRIENLFSLRLKLFLDDVLHHFSWHMT